MIQTDFYACLPHVPIKASGQVGMQADKPPIKYGEVTRKSFCGGYPLNQCIGER